MAVVGGLEVHVEGVGGGGGEGGAGGEEGEGQRGEGGGGGGGEERVDGVERVRGHGGEDDERGQARFGEGEVGVEEAFEGAVRGGLGLGGEEGGGVGGEGRVVVDEPFLFELVAELAPAVGKQVFDGQLEGAPRLAAEELVGKKVLLLPCPGAKHGGCDWHGSAPSQRGGEVPPGPRQLHEAAEAD